MFALMWDIGSSKLFIGSRSYDGAWDFVVAVVNVVAVILFLAVIMALMIYHWFPDSSRKYSWRRKRSRKPGQSFRAGSQWHHDSGSEPGDLV